VAAPSPAPIRRGPLQPSAQLAEHGGGDAGRATLVDCRGLVRPRRPPRARRRHVAPGVGRPLLPGGRRAPGRPVDAGGSRRAAHTVNDEDLARFTAATGYLPTAEREGRSSVHPEAPGIPGP
jgi:hypothetical protein